MDPNAALRRLRDLLNGEDFDEADVASASETLNEAIDVFEGLDSWIKSGGFLPQEWDPDWVRGGPKR